jgi:peptide deformylase
MAFQETVQIGHPSLKALNTEITDFKLDLVKELVQDLTDTMRKNELVGMAGSQIARNYKIFVTEPRVTQLRTIDQSDELRVYINPTIVNSSKEACIIYEGCGSVLNGTLFGPVLRPKEITIEAFDKDGKKFQLRCDGLLARVILHEFDHLNGIEFTEKVHDYKNLMAKEFYILNIKNSAEQVNNSKITVKEFRYL